MHSNKFKSIILLLAGICVTALINSCKKDDLSPLKNYLSNYGRWQLVSLQVSSFKHSTATANIISTDTLATSCADTTQTFVFKTDGTCTNFDFNCNSQTNQGNWSINTDSLILHATIAVPDTAATEVQKKIYPFATCVLGAVGSFAGSLGSSSLVFLTGDVHNYYPDNDVHRIYRYSFIHPTAK